MQGQRRYSRPVMVGVLAVAGFVLAVLLSTRTVFGRDSESDNGRIARGAGTTIIHGGTGAPNFVPLNTPIAFLSERARRGGTGELERLALAPHPPRTGAVN